MIGRFFTGLSDFVRMRESLVEQLEPARKRHFLQVESKIYEEIASGILRYCFYEHRRKFRVNDLLCFEECKAGVKTGKKHGPAFIKYILYGASSGLHEGQCILGFRNIEKREGKKR